MSYAFGIAGFPLDVRTVKQAIAKWTELYTAPPIRICLAQDQAKDLGLNDVDGIPVVVTEVETRNAGADWFGYLDDGSGPNDKVGIVSRKF